MKSLKQNTDGFTVVEVLVSLLVIGILLSSATVALLSTSAINAKTSNRAEASEYAFQKIQNYVNTAYDNLPVGDDVNNYEVEDFSSELEESGLRNPAAKVYVEPASVVDSESTTETDFYNETVNADSSISSGSEITASDTDDPTNCCRYDYRLADNNDYNLVYNNYEPGSSNQPLPVIDLGSQQTVNSIRINWYSAYYTSENFRIEASNNLSSWTTVASGLSTNVGVGTSVGNYPEDYSVNGTYRYWRMFNVTGTHGTWIAISEMEAFSAASGDIVEQSSGGALDFSSDDIDLVDNGGDQQSVGLRFKDVDLDQGTSIDSAYIQFTADESDSDDIELLVQGVDADDASGWSGSSAVDNAVAGSGSTSATTNWVPAAWNGGDEGDAQQADVTSIVQEILDRGGWSSGNSMAFAITRVSGPGHRVATKSPVPQLVIDWSETNTIPGDGTYVDADDDGDADNPTLLKVRVNIEFDLYGQRDDVEYTTLIRKFGIGS